MSEDEFDDVGGGDWIKGRDYVGHWVLFRVRSVDTRPSSFADGKDETVAEVDFADLTVGSDMRRVKISDAYVAGKLKAGKKVVGLIEQLPSKRAGWQGAIVLNQPDGQAYGQAKDKARALLQRESKPAAKPAAPPARTEAQELDELLGMGE
jgi:hypothetical protein